MLSVDHEHNSITIAGELGQPEAFADRIIILGNELQQTSYTIKKATTAGGNTTLDFGDMKLLGAAWEATFRMLWKQRRAELSWWPRILCSEGEPAELTAIEQLIVLAPQEIPIGPPTEYNSTFLGLMMSGRAIFGVAKSALFMNLFLGGATSIPEALVKIFAVYLWSVFVGAVFPRFRAEQSVRFFLGWPMWLGLAGIAFAMVMKYLAS